MGTEFGKAARYYRENLPPDESGPKLKLTAVALVNWLNDRGWSTSSGQWSEVESGKNDAPRDSGTLLSLLKEALRLNDQQFADMKAQLAWDVVAGKLGETMADQFVPEAAFRRQRRGTF